MLSYHGNAVLVLESHTKLVNHRARLLVRVKTKTKENELEFVFDTGPSSRWIGDAERAESAGERAERAGRIVGRR